MAEGFSPVQGVYYFQRFAPTPSSSSVQFLAALANEYGVKIFRVDVAQACVCAKLDHDDICMKLHVRKPPPSTDRCMI